MNKTTTDASPSSDADTRRSAEVIPFPICRTETGRFVAREYARRPVKGRYNKAIYAAGVIEANTQIWERLGVASERIQDEIASLESMFEALSDDTPPQKASA